MGGVWGDGGGGRCMAGQVWGSCRVGAGEAQGRTQLHKLRPGTALALASCGHREDSAQIRRHACSLRVHRGGDLWVTGGALLLQGVCRAGVGQV